jgi:hypothetical protein
VNGWRNRKPSYEKKKNVLSLKIGPPRTPPKSFLVLFRFRQMVEICDPIVGIQRAISEIFEERAMISIRAGARHNRNLSARHAPELGSKRRCLYAELFHRVHCHQTVGAYSRFCSRVNTRFGNEMISQKKEDDDSKERRLFAIIGVGEYGQGKFGTDKQRQMNLIDNLSVTEAGHQLKLGVDYRWLAPFSSPFSYRPFVQFSGVACPPAPSPSLPLSWA